MPNLNAAMRHPKCLWLIARHGRLARLAPEPVGGPPIPGFPSFVAFAVARRAALAVMRVHPDDSGLVMNVAGFDWKRLTGWRLKSVSWTAAIFSVSFHDFTNGLAAGKKRTSTSSDPSYKSGENFISRIVMSRMRYLAALVLAWTLALAPAGARASALDHALAADWLQLRERYPTPNNPMLVVVDVARQSLYLLDDGALIDTWQVSTGLRGTGNRVGGYTTPLGVFDVVRKIGSGLPEFAVLSSATVTGAIANPVFKSGDPRASLDITTRILWLEGLQPGWNEGGDVDTYARHIFIHGTANLGMLGEPASLGCVQLAPGAMISLYRHVPLGTLVLITQGTGNLRHIPGDQPFADSFLAGNTRPPAEDRVVSPTAQATSNPAG